MPLGVTLSFSACLQHPLQCIGPSLMPILIPEMMRAALHNNPMPYLLTLPQCIGPSMMPTFNPRGDVTLVEHVSVLTNNIQIGDVVLARSAQVTPRCSASF